MLYRENICYARIFIALLHHSAVVTNDVVVRFECCCTSDGKKRLESNISVHSEVRANIDGGRRMVDEVGVDQSRRACV